MRCEDGRRKCERKNSFFKYYNIKFFKSQEGRKGVRDGSFSLRTEREVRVLYEGGNGCRVSGFGKWLRYFQTTTKSRHIGKWNGVSARMKCSRAAQLYHIFGLVSSSNIAQKYRNF